MPTCSSASPKNRTLLAFRINQGISASFSLLLSGPPGPLKDQQALSASFSLLLSYHRLRTTRFWSIKGPTMYETWVCERKILNNFILDSIAILRENPSREEEKKLPQTNQSEGDELLSTPRQSRRAGEVPHPTPIPPRLPASPVT